MTRNKRAVEKPEIGKKMTKEQWRAMHITSLEAEREAMARQSEEKRKAFYWSRGQAAPV